MSVLDLIEFRLLIKKKYISAGLFHVGLFDIDGILEDSWGFLAILSPNPLRFFPTPQTGETETNKYKSSLHHLPLPPSLPPHTTHQIPCKPPPESSQNPSGILPESSRITEKD